MSAENRTVQRLRAEYVVAEIDSVTTDAVVIKGTFPHGLQISLHPGAEVVILTLDEAIDELSAE